MATEYKNEIAQLIHLAPFGIDPNMKLPMRLPTMANSMFLTHKEQGDWAEDVVFRAINTHSNEYRAVKYGRRDAIAAGEPGFAKFYRSYVSELNGIGKKPDLLIYRRGNVPTNCDLEDERSIGRAIAAIEVRSSSFLANKYSSFMENRARQAESEVQNIRRRILTEPYSTLLQDKSEEIYRLISNANKNTFRELDFRPRNWSSTEHLRELSDLLKSLKKQIKVLHKRDYLSITPKVEDLSLVNRWIQNYGVKHYYLQVFFDKAYIIPFKTILQIVCDPSKEGSVFSIEQDVKNQGKTTIKINVKVGKEILGRIDMPNHLSAYKEFERGRLLFYVAFSGGRGYLDPNVFSSEIVNGT